MQIETLHGCYGICIKYIHLHEAVQVSLLLGIIYSVIIYLTVSKTVWVVWSDDAA